MTPDRQESATIIVYSQDSVFCRKVAAYLDTLARIAVAETGRSLHLNVRQNPDSVIVLDLRADRSMDFLDLGRGPFKDAVVVAVGDARSDPGLVARSTGVYSVESLDDCMHLQMSVVNALSLVELKRRNSFLDEQNRELKATIKAHKERQTRELASERRIFLGTFREFGSVNSLLENVAHEISNCASVSRVGVFLADTSLGAYRFRAGVNCLQSSREIIYQSEGEFACWLEIKGHIISRETIAHVEDPVEKMMLLDILKDMGADAVIPFRSGRRPFGWIFIGPHATGMPFTLRELEDIGRIAQQVSSDIKKESLTEEIGILRMLQDAIMNAMPLGLISVETDGSIGSVNRRAADLIGAELHDLGGARAECLGPRIADAIHRALDGEELLQAYDFHCPQTGIPLSLETRSLSVSEECCGALAILSEKCEVESNDSTEENVKRAAFWVELASAMSHEIHNPLVAIKTFTQLLPERYADAEFRNEFRARMLNEINRLTGIVEQINRFANPPQLIFRTIDLRDAVNKGAESAAAEFPRLKVNIRCDDAEIPKIKGDEKALTECFSHLVQNCIEARDKNTEADIEIRLMVDDADGKQDSVAIEIEDKGKGLSPEIADNVFSPFCTTKARGMGLGLPLARRIVEDHRGKVEISNAENGALVSILIPINCANR